VLHIFLKKLHYLRVMLVFRSWPFY